jgi:hypothetical protein
MTASHAKNAILNLTIQDLDTFPSLIDLLKSKKKGLLSEKAAVKKAEKEAIAALEKKERKAQAAQKKNDDSLLEVLFQMAGNWAKNNHKQLLKELSEKHIPGGPQQTERKWNKGSYARFCKYITPDKLQMTDLAIKDAGGKKKWNSEQWRLLSKDIQNSSDSEWNIQVESEC